MLRSQVLRASLRLLEERGQKFAALRQALIVGEDNGDAGPMDVEASRREAKRDAGLNG